MSFYDSIRIGASGAADYEVERSIRGDDLQSSPHRLQRSVQSGGNKNKWTLSVWVKRSQLGNTAYSNSSGNDGQQILHAAGAGNRGLIKFKTDDSLAFEQGTDGGYSAGRIHTNAKFRDTASWYHLCFVADYANSTVADRAKIFVNGVRQEVTTTVNFFDGSASDDCIINRDRNHDIGFAEYAQGYTGSSWWFNFFCGYMAEYYFIDNQALDPTSFTETNVVTGQLVPKEYEGTFGTTGWYLAFTDNSGVTATTLGKDYSGNGNNWTPNGFSTGDFMKDSPTNNFATMNPLNGYTGLSEGNLRFNTYNDSSGPRSAQSTIAIPKSGKWYWEARYQESGTGTVTTKYFGVSQLQDKNGYVTAPYVYYDGGSGVLRNGNSSDNKNGKQIWYNGTGVPAVLAIAVDVDNNSVEYFHNGSSQGTIPLPTLTSLQEYFFTWANTSGGSSSSLNDTFNFGADSTFQGQISSGGNTDANGIGDFKYAPPAGHLALCSKNLSDPTIKLPNQHFNTLLYTGNDSSDRDITGVGFQPDWLWIKNRQQTDWHQLCDAVRGANNALFSNTNDGESTDNSNGHVNSFLPDGFNVDAGASGNVNENNENYVAWNWNAGGTDSATYTVKVVSDSGNKYRFNNFGTSAVTLDLAEGGTYTFDGSDSSMSGHPFVIGTAANGSVYSTGVTYQLDGASVTYSAYTSGYSSATTRKLIITVPASAPQLYYWCSIHSGMGGAINTNTTLGSSNFDGSIQSTVKANTTAGFSIITYTGNGSNGSSVGHGLGVTPDAVIIKRRDSTGNWIFESPHTYNGRGMYLNFNNGSDSAGTDTTSRSSTLVTFDNSSDSNRRVNHSGDTYVMYCFSNVASYSKIGKYSGNGSTDGAFEYTGFRPAWMLIKRTDSNGNWFILDNKRDTFNEVTKDLYPNTNGSETDNPNFLDFLSNGFKLRTVGTSVNAGTMIYIAFAESPLKNSRAR